MLSRPLSRSDGTLFPFFAKVTAYRGEVTLFCWLGTSLISYTVRQGDFLLIRTVWFRDKKVTRTFKKLTLQASRRDHRGTGHEKPRVSFSLSLFFATYFTIWEPCTTILIVAQFSVTERLTSFPGFSPTSNGTRFLKDVFKNYKRFLSGEE